jgi:hypothetical protein
VPLSSHERLDFEVSMAWEMVSGYMEQWMDSIAYRKRAKTRIDLC